MIHMLLKMKLDLTKFKCCLVFYPNHDRHALKPRQNMAYFCFYLKVPHTFHTPFCTEWRCQAYSVLFISVSGTYNLLWEMILNCIISPPCFKTLWWWGSVCWAFRSSYLSASQRVFSNCNDNSSMVYHQRSWFFTLPSLFTPCVIVDW